MTAMSSLSERISGQTLVPNVSALQILLRGVGTALPALRVSQAELQPRIADAMRLSRAARSRWSRICESSGISFRHGVVPLEDVVHLTTAQRMRLYEQHAPGLALEAARAALRAAKTAPSAITDLIVVSCTGFSAPGVDIDLVEALGLRRDVRRTMISFMGCFGAINGLRAAIGACAADRFAVALVVCIELCSLHLRPDDDAQNLVASALFADGAAAAVVASDGAGADSDREAVGMIQLGRGFVFPHGRDWMSWRITDHGFAMTLSREIPVALQAQIACFVDDSCPNPPRTFLVHPGGPGILDAVDAALKLRGGQGLQHAQAVLSRCGNMSSGTVLFVLADALRNDCPLPALLLAFGPGLTIESMTLAPRSM